MLGGVIALAGCGTLLRNPVPVSAATMATIPHLPDIRIRAGQPSAAMEQDLADSFAQESRRDFPRAADGTIRYAHLALSGGGASGAFGAGFLNGWSQAGDRPRFKIVTGVSTGALMAPFALLGPAYDGALRDFYTTTSSRDIFIVGSLLTLAGRLLGGEALLDTGPLSALIDQTRRCRPCCARSAKPTSAGSGSTSVPWTSIPSISSSGTWGSSPSADARNPWISFVR